MFFSFVIINKYNKNHLCKKVVHKSCESIIVLRNSHWSNAKIALTKHTRKLTKVQTGYQLISGLEFVR